MAPNTEKKGMQKELSYGALMHVYDHDDEGVKTEISKEAVQAVVHTINEHYSNALASHVLAFQLYDVLSHRGFTKETTLLGTSFCCDDVCRDLEDELRAQFDSNYSLGGLAGFCFGGVPAIADLLHHIPQPGGNALIVYGPHVGVDWDGTIGKVNRRGHARGSGVCCASATAAADAILTRPPATVIDMMTNAQQSFLEQQLGKHAARLANNEDRAKEIPRVLLESQHEFMDTIVSKAISQLPKGAQLALLGGIQINTPEGTGEYFLPSRFVVYDEKGRTDCMVEELHDSVANTAGW